MGAIKDTRFTEALRRAVMREIEVGKGDEARTAVALDALAETLIIRGVGGDVAAIKEIFDRLEGKAKQTLEADVTGHISLVDALIAVAGKEKEQKEE